MSINSVGFTFLRLSLKLVNSNKQFPDEFFLPGKWTTQLCLYETLSMKRRRLTSAKVSRIRGTRKNDTVQPWNAFSRPSYDYLYLFKTNGNGPAAVFTLVCCWKIEWSIMWVSGPSIFFLVSNATDAKLQFSHTLLFLHIYQVLLVSSCFSGLFFCYICLFFYLEI